MKINEETRQKTFDTFKTTDDHLMHLVGTATDQNGNIYYITKNSWAQDSNNYGGILYMSESYVRLKTVAIQVHKNAIPPSLKTKLNMN
jgi:bleomycin hydrolase